MKLSNICFFLLVAFLVLSELPSAVAKGGGGKGGGGAAKPAAAPAKADAGGAKPAAAKDKNNSNHDPSCDECQPCHHKRSLELLEMWDDTQLLRRGTVWDEALHQRGEAGGALSPALEDLLARAFSEDGQMETTLFKRIPPSDGGAALVNAIAATIRRKQHTCTGCTLRPILGNLSSKFCFSYGGGFRKRSYQDELDPPIDEHGTSYPHIAAVHDAVAFLRRENRLQ